MQRKVILFILATALAMPLHAITDQERSELQRLYTELEATKAIIAVAEKAENSEDRRKISYAELRKDLEKMLQGLRDAINSERREPRSLPPVKGKY